MAVDQLRPSAALVDGSCQQLHGGCPRDRGQPGRSFMSVGLPVQQHTVPRGTARTPPLLLVLLLLADRGQFDLQICKQQSQS